MRIGLVIHDNDKFFGFYPTSIPQSPIADSSLTVSRDFATGMVTITDGGDIVTRQIESMLKNAVVINSRIVPDTLAIIKAIETFPSIKARTRR